MTRVFMMPLNTDGATSASSPGRLDEFFEVRAAPHITAAQKGETQGRYSSASFEAVARMVHALVERQYALYNEALVPAFAQHGIRILGHNERSPAQRRWVHEYFHNEVRPLLIPVGLDPAHPFPQVANKSLNFIVRLSGQDAFGRENEIAIVKVPRVLPRLVLLCHKVDN
jgi:polyphosphate kinase